MSVVRKYIPPLASDYSGVCAIVFAMESLNILYSPGGCSHPVAEVDEGRNLFDTTLFGTRMNDADVAQGSDEKLIKALKEMDLSPFPFISLIGTPIPDLIGLNLERSARRVEKELNKPVVFFESNGFESYPIGIADSYLKLADRCLDFSDGKSPEKQINIIGYNPFVWGDDRHLCRLVDYFSGSSLKFNLLGCKQEGCRSNTISPGAQLNLVISEEGTKLARELKEKYAIPYLSGLPVGITEMYQFLSGLEQALDISLPAKAKVEKERSKYRRDLYRKKVLIIGEPFFSLALRKCLQKDFGMEKICLVSLLKKESKSQALFAKPKYAGVWFLKSEEEIRESAAWADVVIADPVFKRMLPAEPDKIFIPMPYCGLSGREFTDLAYDYIGIEGFNYLNKYLL